MIEQPSLNALVRLHKVPALLAVLLNTLTMPTGDDSPAAPTPFDDVDRRLLTLLHQDPQIGVLGASRALGIARGTVQARLTKLTERGVLASWAPQLDPAAMGYPVTAFCTLEIRQDFRRESLTEHLQRIPQVLEAHTTTGEGDVMVTVVAADTTDLQRVIEDLLADERVLRCATVIGLTELISRRVLPLVQAKD